MSEGSLHTLQYGEGRGAVVFLHGLFGQGRNWSSIGKALATDHPVTLVDLPNHGRSAWTDRVDYVQMADIVATEVLAPLAGTGPVALVGHSMGGKTAMMLALRHPELVERLVVADVSPVAYGTAREFVGYIETLRDLDLGALDNRAEAEAALGLPEGVHSYALLPIGYPLGKFGPVRRAALEDVTFADHWGQAFTDV